MSKDELFERLATPEFEYKGASWGVMSAIIKQLKVEGFIKETHTDSAFDTHYKVLKKFVIYTKFGERYTFTGKLKESNILGIRRTFIKMHLQEESNV